MYDIEGRMLDVWEYKVEQVVSMSALALISHVLHRWCSVGAVFMYVCVAPHHFGAGYTRLYF